MRLVFEYRIDRSYLWNFGLEQIRSCQWIVPSDLDELATNVRPQSFLAQTSRIFNIFLVSNILIFDIKLVEQGQ